MVFGKTEARLKEPGATEHSSMNGMVSSNALCADYTAKRNGIELFS